LKVTIAIFHLVSILHQRHVLVPEIKTLHWTSSHDVQRSSGPRPVKLCSNQQIFQFLFRTISKYIQEFDSENVNSNFHFEDCGTFSPYSSFSHWLREKNQTQLMYGSYWVFCVEHCR
jgi:hypothetical protein